MPTISLMDEDFSHIPIINWFDSDDLLDETKVTYGEHFTLDGAETEVFSIEPYLRIRHRCSGTEREDFLDLSQFAPDPTGIIHVGRIVLSMQGYTVMPFHP
ncbi:unnamed protein product [Caenorhabditis sp. 36 PRJEB53466]|nr:unnamed protein product [Caenorhabditis sp. 36 PRJEB53466]